MKKSHKETEEILLAHEKKVLNDLEQAYARALADVKKRIQELTTDIEFLERTGVENESLIRSKVYQLEYQKSLQSQIKSYMDTLKKSTVTTTESYLKQMYEDSYIAQFYVLHKAGIPVIAPINVEKLLKAVNMKVDGFKFSKRMYDDVEELGKVTIEEITQGIAQGKSYIDIADRVAQRTEATLKQAYTIARTEGGRVSSMAKVDSQKKAKEMGADIVKQWDSMWDNKTRPQHQALDGQIREIDEDFEYKGMKAKAPRMFGVPHMDINCRCVMLTIPRWDIDDTRTKRDYIEEREPNKDQLVQAKNYKEWKTKYYDKLKEKQNED